MKNFKTIIGAAALCITAGGLQSADWPGWGRDSSRNLYTPTKPLPNEFAIGEFKRGSEEVDMESTKNIRWVGKLGSSAYGNTTVSNGRVFIGTNNEVPRDPKITGDYSMVYCFDETNGEFQWQLAVPKLGAGKVSDWEFLGICSSPAVEGNRVYLMTSRCEVMCIDFNGMKDGNQGFQDEGIYMAGAGNPPLAVGENDADIIWVYDMREELGVFPHNVTSSSVLIYKDKIFATTSNGQDWSHLNIPSPFAPSLVCLDKNTGKYLGEEASGIGERIMHCNWSSPALATINGEDMIIFGAGDGYTYAFGPNPVPDPEDPEIKILPEIWRFNCVPSKYTEKKYPHAEGPSEIIATPVVYKNRVYVSIGQDPEHGEGVGNMVCIDATGKGDITATGAVWQYEGLHRTVSTISIDPENDLVFCADYSGYVHCVDANTGKPYWIYDMKAHMWSSTLVGDGKVFASDEDGDFVALPSRRDFDPKKDKPIFETNFEAPIYSSPIEANGTVYVATQSHLYAIGGASNVPPTTDKAPTIELKK